ncbi:hypothetical protein ABVT39_011788 [Epinephelus coioides]
MIPTRKTHGDAVTSTQLSRRARKLPDTLKQTRRTENTSVADTHVGCRVQSADVVRRLSSGCTQGMPGWCREGRNGSFSSKLRFLTQPIRFSCCPDASDSGVKFQSLLFL